MINTCFELIFRLTIHGTLSAITITCDIITNLNNTVEQNSERCKNPDMIKRLANQNNKDGGLLFRWVNFPADVRHYPK